MVVGSQCTLWVSGSRIAMKNAALGYIIIVGPANPLLLPAIASHT